MTNDIEFDFSEQITAKTETTCDSCSKKLGGRYPYAAGSISIPLKTGATNEYGDEEYKENHFCSEGCLKDYLNKR